MDIDAHLWAKVDMRIKVPVKIEGSFTMNYTDKTPAPFVGTKSQLLTIFFLWLPLLGQVI